MPRPSERPPPATPRELDLGRASRHLFRALRRRCPHCGGSGIFTRWVRMRSSCPGCHLRLDRGEPDYFIGSFVINFVTAELLIVVGGLVAILLTWPEVPWEGLKWGLMLTIAPVPFLFYPFARTIWLAIDLTFRPPVLAEFEGHGENRGGHAEPGAARSGTSGRAPLGPPGGRA